MRYPKAIVAANHKGEVRLIIADSDYARLITTPLDGRGARVRFGGEGIEEHDPAGLATAERERRFEAMKVAAPEARPERFRELTNNDPERDHADRELRWETLGADPLAEFEALLRRARVRGAGP